MKNLLAFAFGLVVAAAAANVPVVLNPSFEEIKNGKAPGWSFSPNGAFRAERGFGHNGSGGMVWESAEPAPQQYACVQTIKLERGLQYKFSCLVKLENFKVSGRGGANICIEWYDANGKWMAGGYSQKNFRDRNSDWTQIEGTTREIPPEAKTVRLQVYVAKGASGRVSFDNVRVQPLHREPVAFVFSSAYRDLAASGRVRFHAAFYADRKYAADDMKAEFSYVDAAGRTVTAAPTEYAVDGATLALDVSSLAKGQHPVTCTLHEKGGKRIGSASCMFTRVDKLPERRVWIDSHQRCIVDGKPFFPLGMYWGKVEREKLKKYAEGPFNCLMPYTRATPADLDLCREMGMMAFVNLKNETLHSEWARRYKITKQEQVDAFFAAQIDLAKDHPALLGWYVNDEAPVTEVPERTHLYSVFRERDPNHPTWAVLDRLHDLREFIPTYDVLGMDPYPVARKPLTHITEFMRGTQKAIFNDRPLWNVPQTFNWAWYRKHLADVERFPTEQEMRNINWQHIALGANGLISYCYHALWRDVKPEEFEDYWQPICRAAADVKRMSPVLLSVDEAPSVKGAPEMVPTRTWMKDGDLYVLAVNAKNEACRAELRISGGAWKAVSCEVGTEGRMSSPNVLAVDLPPLGVSFMRLSSAPAAEARCGRGESSIEVDPGKARFPVSEDMWGIFFEDIDLSLDGGVYAEMVRNRSFEDDEVKYRRQRSVGFWNTVGPATLARDSEKPISDKNRHCGRVEALPGGGVANDGYFGMSVKKGAKYRLSVALRGDLKGPIEVSLESLGRPAFAKGRIDGVGAEWKTFALELTSAGTDPDAKLVFRAPHGGTFFLDCVSLFPCDTYGKSGLFRKDLMERLAALKPSFVRFPGGCWVEGDTMAEAYRWKQTIGSVWDRRTQWNLWGYWSANGVGFHEYLVLCEELGAKALFCINCGMSHKENVPMDKMGEFVQDALDCIEYANGPATSKWGAVRAANGHPAPFNLEYLEIGNENGGPAYHERYALIHDAVRAKYPEIKIVSDVWHGPVKGRPQHIRDEHYYKSPDWFMSSGAKLYDNCPRGEFEVFVGEYAVTQDVGRWGDLRSAIGEAAFMCGLERNADIVKLAAYAPLFANAKHTSWTPNLIYPTTDGNFVNPSWNVQKLFSENRGREVLEFSISSPWIKTKKGAPCRAVAASAVRDADGSIIVKAVNCSEEEQQLSISLTGAKIAAASKTWFTGPGARACNSPLVRDALKERSGAAAVKDGAVTETLPPLSLTVFRIGNGR